MQLYNYKKGYTLLFSIIVASVVLSIAAFILSVSRKQFILSTSARDSTVAIYAADSGIQCMIETYSQIEKYYSQNEGNSSSTKFPDFPTSVMYCGNSVYNKQFSSIEVTDPDEKTDISKDMDLDSSQRIFQTFPVPKLGFGSSCAIVTLTQGYSKADPNRRVAVIDSRGYNMIAKGPCIPSTALNPRVLERAIRLIYKY